jgi:hypothetical protein
MYLVELRQWQNGIGMQQSQNRLNHIQPVRQPVKTMREKLHSVSAGMSSRMVVAGRGISFPATKYSQRHCLSFGSSNPSFTA